MLFRFPYLPIGSFRKGQEQKTGYAVPALKNGGVIFKNTCHLFDLNCGIILRPTFGR
jgi:hypothetical protein